jgi:uncharacterized protein (TIGR00369 family)
MNTERQTQLLQSFDRSKMIQLFGAKVKKLDTGYMEIIIPKQDFMTRPAGMFNGSTIASLVDVSAGYAAASAKPTDSYFTTVELKVNYLNPATGDFLVAKAIVIKSGKVLTVVRSDIYSLKEEQESLVATSLVTMMEIHKR